MSETFTVIVITAVATAFVTIALSYLVYILILRKKMEHRMLELADMMQERVKRGALEAGEELLPRFREQVTEGFKRALREWSTGDLRNKARTGMSLVEESLTTLLGGPRRPQDKD